jgi:hypothetical protein
MLKKHPNPRPCAISHSGETPDEVKEYNEIEVKNGYYGTVNGFIKALFQQEKRKISRSPFEMEIYWQKFLLSIETIWKKILSAKFCYLIWI